MQVHDIAPALAVLAFLCGGNAAHSQMSQPTLASALRDTSLAGMDDGSAAPDSAAADTTQIDLRTEEPRSAHGWLSSPSFFEIRLLTSRHSTIPSRMATTQYRDLYIVDLRAGWTLASNGFMSVEYVPSVVPLAISTRNPREYEPRVRVTCALEESCSSYSALSIKTVPLYSNTYGFGVTPVGFQMRAFRSSPVQLLTYAHGGALWFTHRIPDPRATRFNFTAELGAALQVNLPDRLALALGYSWHHTSNAGTGKVNPGLNSRALSVSVVARR